MSDNYSDDIDRIWDKPIVPSPLRWVRYKIIGDPLYSKERDHLEQQWSRHERRYDDVKPERFSPQVRKYIGIEYKYCGRTLHTGTEHEDED